MLNSVCMLGRIAQDLELKNSSSGLPYLNFSIANSKRSKDGEDEVSFFKLVAFGKIAETIFNYFSKGDRILIQGELKQNSYTDKEGVKKSDVSIIVSAIDFVETKKQNNNQGAKNTQSTQSTKSQGGKSIMHGVKKQIEIYDEEIPF